jgi:hypothetical protein
VIDDEADLPILRQWAPRAAVVAFCGAWNAPLMAGAS